MVRIALKHYIYDLCIHQLMERISTNMRLTNSPIPHIGDVFSKIYVPCDDVSYYDCQIIHIGDTGLADTYTADEFDGALFAIRYKRMAIESDDILIYDADEAGELFDDTLVTKEMMVGIEYIK